MPAINFPSGFFLSKTSGQPIALGRVYIGEQDLDPTVEGNRINVTVIQENGTPVVVAPNQQPFVLNAAGMLVYGGSVVQMRTGGNCSIAVYSSTDVLQYYFPSASSNEDVTASLIQLIAQGSPPVPFPGGGWIYSMIVDGIAEFFYMDSVGNAIQFSRAGAPNIDLPASVIEALQLIAEEQMEASQFRGDPITLTIDESGNVDCDLTLGLNYYLEMDQNVNTFSFSNAPEIRVPNILVKIKNTGEFDIAIFEFLAEGGTVEVPDSVEGGLSPAHNATTDYGLALFPGSVLSIYPVLMKAYAP